MRQSPALRCRIEQALVSGPITLHVDLHECVYMDSTFLGMLIMFRRMLVNRHLGQFALVAPSPECSRLLRQMGLDATFCILAEESSPDVPEELLESETDAPYSQRNIVEAHQELAALPGPAGEIFRDVAAHLQHDWERRQNEPTAAGSG
jgi:anti-anti-sigma factor